MTDSLTIKERINNIMQKTNHNYRSFGKLLGFSDVVVGNIIKGRNNPSYTFLSKLIQTFDWLNAYWLLTGEGEMLRKRGEDEPPAATTLKGTTSTKLETLLESKDKEIERLMSIIEMMIKEGNAGQEVAEKRKTG